jgi:hypothetical protein
VLGVEVPFAADVEKGVECILSFLQAVWFGWLGLDPAVVDRE